MLNPSLGSQLAYSSPARDTSRRLLKFSFSISQFVSDSVSLGLALYIQFSSLPLAISIGVISGILSAVTTWGFKGPVIDSCLGNPTIEPVSTHSRWYSPLTAKIICWLYTPARLIQEFGMNYFILDSILAWLKAFSQHHTLHLAMMSDPGLAGVVLYTLIFNVPFVLSNEIVETCQQIAIRAGLAPKPPIIAALLYPLRCLRHFISSAGAAMHSVEHLLNLLLLIPPMWIVCLLQLTSVYQLIAIASVIAITGVLFLVHLVQTYFFEGRHTLINLITLEREPTESERTYKISHTLEYYALKFSHALLDTQSIFHAADDARIVLLGLVTAGYPLAAQFLGAVQFVVVAFGVQCSSIYEAKQTSQEALELYESTHACLR
jgi:hypothetical protein